MTRCCCSKDADTVVDGSSLEALYFLWGCSPPSCGSDGAAACTTTVLRICYLCNLPFWIFPTNRLHFFNKWIYQNAIAHLDWADVIFKPHIWCLISAWWSRFHYRCNNQQVIYPDLMRRAGGEMLCSLTCLLKPNQEMHYEEGLLCLSSLVTFW